MDSDNACYLTMSDTHIGLTLRMIEIYPWDGDSDKGDYRQGGDPCRDNHTYQNPPGLPKVGGG